MTKICPICIPDQLHFIFIGIHFRKLLLLIGTIDSSESAAVVSHEKRSHFALPAFVHITAFHFSQRLLEIGRFQISKLAAHRA